MTEQRTLEDVGVKRTRQSEDTKPKSNGEAATDSQPQPKKAHTESGDTKGKAKENQGSKSNAASQQNSADTQDKATAEPKKSQAEAKPAEHESKKGDTEPEQLAAEATAGQADPKAPLSTSVAKPEGNHYPVFRHHQHQLS